MIHKTAASPTALHIVITLLGSLIIFFASLSTIYWSELPSFLSPYSFTVVVPIFYILALGSKIPSDHYVSVFATMPVVTLYLVWTLLFAQNTLRIRKPTIALYLLLAALSTLFLLFSYNYGVNHRGLAHTLGISTFCVSILIVLGAVLRNNIKKPTRLNFFSFHILLFSWLGWVSFPWLGELI